VSLLLLRGTRGSKAEPTVRKSFDWPGLIAFIVAMVALNVVSGQGTALGWLSPTISLLAAVFLVSIALFFKIEIDNANGFVDLTLFDNKTFSGATLSNFLLNGAAGTLLVVLTLVQKASGLSSPSDTW
jgi:MFS transporter, DHA2 family, multidrug resistance protein